MTPLRTIVLPLKAAVLSSLAMFPMPRSEKLTERKLDNVAVISLPAGIKEEILKGIRSDQADRLAFTFASSYFWASFGSVTRYKQMIVVSIMAPTASAASYSDWPRAFSISLDKSRVVHTSTSGQATLTVRTGTYEKGAERVEAHRFEYADPSRRLHIIWHAVADEMPMARGLELLPRIAASFRMIGDAGSQFAEMSDRPRREAAERARRLALAKRTMSLAGLPSLEPGKPVFKDGVYIEWMSDPEPRFQLLVPLGRVKAASANGGIPLFPTQPSVANGARTNVVGAVGWLAWRDDAWELSNHENAYLPFNGIAGKLRSSHTSRAEVSYYYSATVRVEEEEDDARLSSLKWFTDGIPEVQRLWREGMLVKGATRITPDD